MKIYYTLLFLFLFLLNANSLLSNDSYERFAIHPKIGISFVEHTASFNQFYGTIDCGLYEKGSGINPSASLFIERSVGNRLYWGLGLAYNPVNGLLSLENSYLSRPDGSLDTVRINTKNELDLKLDYFSFSPEIRFILFEKFINGPLRIMGKFNIMIPFNHTFVQSESVVSPDNAVFINNDGSRTQIRELASGSIETSSNMAYGVSFGIENLLRVGSNRHLSQQLSFDYNINSILDDANLNFWAVKLELGLRFGVIKKVKLPEPIPEPAPYTPPVIESVTITEFVPPALPLINLSVEKINATINRAAELTATTPLVTAVFFEENSSELPSFYSKKPLAVDIRSIDAVNAHKYLLPRIAEIMENNPGGSILLEPATAGINSELDGIELARQRGNSVKNALINLGISENRILVSPRLEPSFPTNPEYIKGVEDNRRCDIILQNVSAYQYVDMLRYSEIKGNIEYSLVFENLPEEVPVYLESELLDSKHKVSNSGIYEYEFRKRVNLDEGFIVFSSKLYSDEIQDRKSTTLYFNELSEGTFTTYFENFDAVLMFNYNSNELTQANRNLLSQLVSRLPDGATINILGSTDELGSDIGNLRLANERATNTSNYIKEIAGLRLNIQTGITTEKFDETTPQGRFLNRSIRVKINTE